MKIHVKGLKQTFPQGALSRERRQQQLQQDLMRTVQPQFSAQRSCNVGNHPQRPATGHSLKGRSGGAGSTPHHRWNCKVLAFLEKKLAKGPEG